ncbi:MAG: sigma-54 dependent transcriptional regulator [Pseudomonadota bacterium]
MNRIIVLDPESLASRRIEAVLEASGYTPVPITDASTLPQHAATAALLLCPFERQREAAVGHSLPTILLDAAADIRRAVIGIKAGASDYLAADCSDQVLTDSIERVLAEAAELESALPVLGASDAMQTLASTIAKVAPTDSPVLITGETGTGKELVARALHASSHRRLAPLISFNCATVPEDLIEGELFGHSSDGRGGLVATATGGTLFLDEIGELPAGAQGRLLHALETDQDIRLISATHRDLDTLVEHGQFRNDLYYRLKVIALAVPPLKDRGGDILLLAEEILTRTLSKLGKQGLTFADAARDDMRRYPWPGNVRELENAIQRAVILADSGEITTELLAIEPPKETTPELPGKTSPDQTIEDYFVSFVTAHQDSMTETELAEKLGISRKSLWERRQRLNIPRTKTKKRGRRRDVS